MNLILPWVPRKPVEATGPCTGPNRRDMWWDLTLECSHRKECEYRQAKRPPAWVRCYECGRERNGMTTLDDLRVERKAQADDSQVAPGLMMTPALNSGYWSYRVLLSEGQAIVGFPKFGTTGIGFAVEDYDWNTNLPYTSKAADIFRHIRKNKGDKLITDERCIRAIELIQQAITEDQAAGTYSQQI